MGASLWRGMLGLTTSTDIQSVLKEAEDTPNAVGRGKSGATVSDPCVERDTKRGSWLLQCRQGRLAMKRNKKNPVGRPPRSMPPKIDASPEEIARTVLKVKPPENWRYMQKDST